MASYYSPVTIVVNENQPDPVWFLYEGGGVDVQLAAGGHNANRVTRPQIHANDANALLAVRADSGTYLHAATLTAVGGDCSVAFAFAPTSTHAGPGLVTIEIRMRSDAALSVYYQMYGPGTTGYVDGTLSITGDYDVYTLVVPTDVAHDLANGVSLLLAPNELGKTLYLDRINLIAPGNAGAIPPDDPVTDPPDPVYVPTCRRAMRVFGSQSLRAF